MLQRNGTERSVPLAILKIGKELVVTKGNRDSLSSHATVGTVMRVPNVDFVVRIVLVLADAQKRESGRSGNSVSRHPTGHES
jgi:hypothetical protein